uniref:tRNA(Ile)-lysidine synthase, chloroplastic n=1 Tax=Cylindrocystis brebissonii TaxID=102167 RepID=A0A191T678_9VIRI|nr:tRNA(Ile)-lysidine synthetase [Cylindrocystis brebissonii]ANI25906.1 tRNA(Ile)-lysidine synthetase [Cylindrocystis brebissonii]
MSNHFLQRQDLSLLYKLNSVLEERRLLKPNEHIFISISGGQDSLSLFLLLHRLSSNWNWKLSIIHCDHKWHSNSVFQAKHISRLALRMNITYYHAISTKNVKTEEKARKWRYELMRRISIFHGYTGILTGHTASDRIESFFLHLTRGTGLNGFHSLSWKRKLNNILTINFCSKSQFCCHFKFICFQEYKQKIQLPKANHNLSIIRPFLSITRTQTTKLIQQWNLYLWLDTSNNSNQIKRNRIRHQLLPYLRHNLNPQIDSLLNNWIEIVHSESIYLENIVEYILFKIFANKQIFPEYETLIIQLLLTLPLTLQRHVLKRFLYINIQRHITFDQIEQIRLSYGINKLFSQKYDKKNFQMNPKFERFSLIHLSGDNYIQINKDVVRFCKNATFSTTTK